MVRGRAAKSTHLTIIYTDTARNAQLKCPPIRLQHPTHQKQQPTAWMDKTPVLKLAHREHRSQRCSKRRRTRRDPNGTPLGRRNLYPPRIRKEIPLLRNRAELTSRFPTRSI
jgi:hypothetical protein